jgi:hypothetical protein
MKKTIKNCLVIIVMALCAVTMINYVNASEAAYDSVLTGKTAREFADRMTINPLNGKIEAEILFSEYRPSRYIDITGVEHLQSYNTDLVIGIYDKRVGVTGSDASIFFDVLVDGVAVAQIRYDRSLNNLRKDDGSASAYLLTLAYMLKPTSVIKITPSNVGGVEGYVDSSKASVTMNNSSIQNLTLGTIPGREALSTAPGIFGGIAFNYNLQIYQTVDFGSSYKLQWYVDSELVATDILPANGVGMSAISRKEEKAKTSKLTPGLHKVKIVLSLSDSTHKESKMSDNTLDIDLIVPNFTTVTTYQGEAGLSSVLESPISVGVNVYNNGNTDIKGLVMQIQSQEGDVLGEEKIDLNTAEVSYVDIGLDLVKAYQHRGEEVVLVIDPGNKLGTRTYMSAEELRKPYTGQSIAVQAYNDVSVKIEAGRLINSGGGLVPSNFTASDDIKAGETVAFMLTLKNGSRLKSNTSTYSITMNGEEKAAKTVTLAADEERKEVMLLPVISHPMTVWMQASLSSDEIASNNISSVGIPGTAGGDSDNTFGLTSLAEISDTQVFMGETLYLKAKANWYTAPRRGSGGSGGGGGGGDNSGSISGGGDLKATVSFSASVGGREIGSDSEGPLLIKSGETHEFFTVPQQMWFTAPKGATVTVTYRVLAFYEDGGGVAMDESIRTTIKTTNEGNNWVAAGQYILTNTYTRSRSASNLMESQAAVYAQQSQGIVGDMVVYLDGKEIKRVSGVTVADTSTATVDIPIETEGLQPGTFKFRVDFVGTNPARLNGKATTAKSADVPVTILPGTRIFISDSSIQQGTSEKGPFSAYVYDPLDSSKNKGRPFKAGDWMKITYQINNLTDSDCASMLQQIVMEGTVGSVNVYEHRINVKARGRTTQTIVLPAGEWDGLTNVTIIANGDGRYLDTPPEGSFNRKPAQYTPTDDLSISEVSINGNVFSNLEIPQISYKLVNGSNKVAKANIKVSTVGGGKEYVIHESTFILEAWWTYTGTNKINTLDLPAGDYPVTVSATILDGYSDTNTNNNSGQVTMKLQKFNNLQITDLYTLDDKSVYSEFENAKIHFKVTNTSTYQDANARLSLFMENRLLAERNIIFTRNSTSTFDLAVPGGSWTDRVTSAFNLLGVTDSEGNIIGGGDLSIHLDILNSGGINESGKFFDEKAEDNRKSIEIAVEAETDARVVSDEFKVGVPNSIVNTGTKAYVYIPFESSIIFPSSILEYPSAAIQLYVDWNKDGEVDATDTMGIDIDNSPTGTYFLTTTNYYDRYNTDKWDHLHKVEGARGFRLQYDGVAREDVLVRAVLLPGSPRADFIKHSNGAVYSNDSQTDLIMAGYEDKNTSNNVWEGFIDLPGLTDDYSTKLSAWRDSNQNGVQDAGEEWTSYNLDTKTLTVKMLWNNLKKSNVMLPRLPAGVTRELYIYDKYGVPKKVWENLDSNGRRYDVGNSMILNSMDGESSDIQLEIIQLKAEDLLAKGIDLESYTTPPAKSIELESRINIPKTMVEDGDTTNYVNNVYKQTYVMPFRTHLNYMQDVPGIDDELVLLAGQYSPKYDADGNLIINLHVYGESDAALTEPTGARPRLKFTVGGVEIQPSQIVKEENITIIDGIAPDTTQSINFDDKATYEFAPVEINVGKDFHVDSDGTVTITAEINPEPRIIAESTYSDNVKSIKFTPPKNNIYTDPTITAVVDEITVPLDTVDDGGNTPVSFVVKGNTTATTIKDQQVDVDIYIAGEEEPSERRVVTWGSNGLDNAKEDTEIMVVNVPKAILEKYKGNRIPVECIIDPDKKLNTSKPILSTEGKIARTYVVVPIVSGDDYIVMSLNTDKTLYNEGESIKITAEFVNAATIDTPEMPTRLWIKDTDSDTESWDRLGSWDISNINKGTKVTKTITNTGIAGKYIATDGTVTIRATINDGQKYLETPGNELNNSKEYTFKVKEGLDVAVDAVVTVPKAVYDSLVGKSSGTIQNAQVLFKETETIYVLGFLQNYSVSADASGRQYKLKLGGNEIAKSTVSPFKAGDTRFIGFEIPASTVDSGYNLLSLYIDDTDDINKSNNTKTTNFTVERVVIPPQDVSTEYLYTDKGIYAEGETITYHAAFGNYTNKDIIKDLDAALEFLNVDTQKWEEIPAIQAKLDNLTVGAGTITPAMAISGGMPTKYVDANGVVNIRAIVNRDNKYPDNDTTNNIKYHKFTISTPKKGLDMSVIKFVTATDKEADDIKQYGHNIEAVPGTSNKYAFGSMVNAVAYIKNIGDLEALNRIIKVYVDDKLLTNTEDSINVITGDFPAGEAAWLSVKIGRSSYITPGKHNLRIEVTPLNDDVDQTNNARSLDFYIDPTAEDVKVVDLFTPKTYYEVLSDSVVNVVIGNDTAQDIKNIDYRMYLYNNITNGWDRVAPVNGLGSVKPMEVAAWSTGKTDLELDSVDAKYIDSNKNVRVKATVNEGGAHPDFDKTNNEREWLFKIGSRVAGLDMAVDNVVTTTKQTYDDWLDYDVYPAPKKNAQNIYGEEEDVYLLAWVGNVGTSVAKSRKVEVTLDGEVIYEVSKENGFPNGIDYGENIHSWTNVMIPYDVIPEETRIGNHILGVKVTPLEDDIDVSNNERFTSFRIEADTGDMSVQNVVVRDASMNTVGQVALGSKVEISADITADQGIWPTAAPIKLYLEELSTGVTYTLPGLAHFSETTAPYDTESSGVAKHNVIFTVNNWSFFGGDGSYRATVVIDPNNAFEESNELNNMDYGDFVVSDIDIDFFVEDGGNEDAAGNRRNKIASNYAVGDEIYGEATFGANHFIVEDTEVDFTIRLDGMVWHSSTVTYSPGKDSFVISLPLGRDLAEGRHIVAITLNDNRTPAEGNYSNNTLTKVFTVGVSLNEPNLKIPDTGHMTYTEGNGTVWTDVFPYYATRELRMNPTSGLWETKRGQGTAMLKDGTKITSQNWIPNSAGYTSGTRQLWFREKISNEYDSESAKWQYFYVDLDQIKPDIPALTVGNMHYAITLDIYHFGRNTLVREINPEITREVIDEYLSIHKTKAGTSDYYCYPYNYEEYLGGRQYYESTYEDNVTQVQFELQENLDFELQLTDKENLIVTTGTPVNVSVTASMVGINPKRYISPGEIGDFRGPVVGAAIWNNTIDLLEPYRRATGNVEAHGLPGYFGFRYKSSKTFNTTQPTETIKATYDINPTGKDETTFEKLGDSTREHFEVDYSNNTDYHLITINEDQTIPNLSIQIINPDTGDAYNIKGDEPLNVEVEVSQPSTPTRRYTGETEILLLHVGANGGMRYLGLESVVLNGDEKQKFIIPTVDSEMFWNTGKNTIAAYVNYTVDNLVIMKAYKPTVESTWDDNMDYGAVDFSLSDVNLSVSNLTATATDGVFTSKKTMNIEAEFTNHNPKVAYSNVDVHLYLDDMPQVTFPRTMSLAAGSVASSGVITLDIPRVTEPAGKDMALVATINEMLDPLENTYDDNRKDLNLHIWPTELDLRAVSVRAERSTPYWRTETARIIGVVSNISKIPAKDVTVQLMRADTVVQADGTSTVVDNVLGVQKIDLSANSGNKTLYYEVDADIYDTYGSKPLKLEINPQNLENPLLNLDEKDYTNNVATGFVPIAPPQNLIMVDTYMEEEILVEGETPIVNYVVQNTNPESALTSEIKVYYVTRNEAGEPLSIEEVPGAIHSSRNGSTGTGTTITVPKGGTAEGQFTLSNNLALGTYDIEVWVNPNSRFYEELYTDNFGFTQFQIRPGQDYEAVIHRTYRIREGNKEDTSTFAENGKAYAEVTFRNNSELIGGTVPYRITFNNYDAYTGNITLAPGEEQSFDFELDLPTVLGEYLIEAGINEERMPYDEYDINNNVAQHNIRVRDHKIGLMIDGHVLTADDKDGDEDEVYTIIEPFLPDNLNHILETVDPTNIMVKIDADSKDNVWSGDYTPNSNKYPVTWPISQGATITAYVEVETDDGEVSAEYIVRFVRPTDEVDANAYVNSDNGDGSTTLYKGTRTGNDWLIELPSTFTGGSLILESRVENSTVSTVAGVPNYTPVFPITDFAELLTSGSMRVEFTTLSPAGYKRMDCSVTLTISNTPPSIRIDNYDEFDEYIFSHYGKDYHNNHKSFEQYKDTYVAYPYTTDEEIAIAFNKTQGIPVKVVVSDTDSLQYLSAQVNFGGDMYDVRWEDYNGPLRILTNGGEIEGWAYIPSGDFKESTEVNPKKLMAIAYDHISPEIGAKTISDTSSYLYTPAYDVWLDIDDPSYGSVTWNPPEIEGEPNPPMQIGPFSDNLSGVHELTVRLKPHGRADWNTTYIFSREEILENPILDIEVDKMFIGDYDIEAWLLDRVRNETERYSTRIDFGSGSGVKLVEGAYGKISRRAISIYINVRYRGSEEIPLSNFAFVD